ncbi:MAG: TonB-dependent receptor [Leptospiraceae bacterium]|nr:TonB-dependent receptor [Leptospiraceae bacterium]
MIFSAKSILAQSGQVSGKIIDSETGDPVFGATVNVRSAGKATKTDFDGKYILDLPPGSHTVDFQMFGYDPQRKKVTITDGKTVNVNITFGIKTLETVEVTDRALNNTEASLLSLQKKSGTVSDGISQEAIKKSPDSSAGEVAKRVSGITLLGGKYVFVRGLGERYSNTMLNDALIPSPEPDKRVVPLDIFPAGLLKNIRVVKTFTPEDSGEFSGGLVKIETQEYPDKFLLNFSVGVGRNYQTTGNKFLTFKGGDFLGRPTASQNLSPDIKDLPEFIPYVEGDRFGGIPANYVKATTFSLPTQWQPNEKIAPYDKNFSFAIGNTFKISENGKKFGILFGSSYSNKYRFREEKIVRYQPGNPIATTVKQAGYISRLQEQDSKVYNEEKLWGNNLNLALDLAEGHKIHWKNLYSVNSDKNVRESDGVNYIDTFQFKSVTNTFTSRQLFNSNLGGTHALNVADRPHKLEWSFSYSQALRDQPNLNSTLWSRGLPTDVATPLRLLGASPNGTRFYSNSQDDVRQYNLSYEIPFNQWNGLKSKLKLGTMHLNREKNFRFRQFNQLLAGSNPVDQNTTIYPVSGDIAFSPLVYFNNQRTFNEFLLANAFDSFQKLKAYYAQVDMPIINKLRFVGGVRYEDSYQKTETFKLTDAANPLQRPGYGCKYNNDDERVLLISSGLCNLNNNGVGELRTQDKLPAANLIYSLNEDMNLRFGYSETLTRPDLRELSPFAFSPYYGAEVVQGNSALERTYIHNYDARWEWYLKGADFVGIGIFNKQLSNPIEKIGQPVAGGISPLFTFANANQAYIRGVELDFRKELWNMFKVETNFFFIKSRVDVLSWETFTAAKAGLLSINSKAFAYDPTNLSRPLQGQSDFVFNFKWDYYITKKKNATIGLYYNYFGDRIYAVGANGTPDAYEKGVGITDIVFRYFHLDKYEFKLTARNIMNTRYRIYQRNELTGRDELFFSYREGMSVYFQAGMKL